MCYNLAVDYLQATEMFESSCFSGTTLDDVMRMAFAAVLANGRPNVAKKGPNKELTGVLLTITNPLARLSRSESRGRIFSCLGELCWYLAGSDDPDFIGYYIPVYRDDAEPDADTGRLILRGAYGPRLLGAAGPAQLRAVTDLLRDRPSTRQAVIQLFSAHDLRSKQKDVPCTCNLQFLLREDALELFVTMRSNDAFLGLPHDVFCFTMIQEIVARELGVGVGHYKHAVGSFHIYDTHLMQAELFIGEGWQETTPVMPAMPFGDPWGSIEELLRREARFRSGNLADDLEVTLDQYWEDLSRLLRVFRHKHDGNAEGIGSTKSKMSSGAYDWFIDQKLVTLKA